MDAPANEVGIAILAGGASSRMGQDKALLTWGGMALIDRAIRIAHAIIGPGATMVVGDRPEYHGRGASVIPDRFPGTGPLGGIATALANWQGDRLLVVAVDMPTLSLELLTAMAKKTFVGDALVPRVTGGSKQGHGQARPEALHAVYRVRSLAAIERNVLRGRLKVATVFDDLDVEYLDEAWLRRYDPELRSFENANTPEVFRRLKQTLEDDR
ncbi:MAG: molybdenum cofactor guanylyltransferase [Thermomicrobiales bacterium]